jgi:hypothetical protein
MMQLIPLHIRLRVILKEGNEGTVLAVMYGEGDPGFPATPSLFYLVSFPGEARPRVVPQDEIVRQVAD